jgi:hypothetical protein
MNFTGITVPQHLREERHGDTELAGTFAQPDSRCDFWPAITLAVATMTIHNGTRACNAMQQLPQSRAGSGCGGNNHYPPVCVSYPQPSDSRYQAEARRIRSKLNQLLEAFDLLGFHAASSVWEEEADLAQQPSQAEPLAASPSFLIVQRSGKLVLTRWGDLSEVSSCMGERGGKSCTPMTVEGGATWQQM